MHFASVFFFDIEVLLLIDLFYSCQQTLCPNRVQNCFPLQSEIPQTMSSPLNPWLFPWLVDQGAKPERLKASRCHPSWYSQSLSILTPLKILLLSRKDLPHHKQRSKHGGFVSKMEDSGRKIKNRDQTPWRRTQCDIWHRSEKPEAQIGNLIPFEGLLNLSPRHSESCFKLGWMRLGWEFHCCPAIL